MAAAGGGRIVAISSTAGVTGSATAGVHYCAAKAGVLGLVRALAAELAPQGILVNAVAPGKVHNPQWEDTPEAREAYARSVPLGRLATAEEISEVIAFLASERNTYTTGATLVVDGGRLAR
jgi:NAD(P)-dependent dehydrogenase (short-subunit alcohol dehydrogenase family)